MDNLFDNLETFDPTKVDLTYIKSVSMKIPKDGHIDLAIAEQLATAFLHCADHITDLICKCSAYAGQCEANRRDVKATAIDERINGEAGTTKVAATVAIQLFGNNEDYKNAHKKQAMAEALLDWLRTKYKNLMAAHVLCKDIIKIYNDSRTKGNQAGRDPMDLDEEENTPVPQEKPGAGNW